MGGHSGRYEVLGPQAVYVRWMLGDGSELILLTNLSSKAQRGSLPDIDRRLWVEGSYTHEGLGPWSVAFGIRGLRGGVE
jgi:hypothetical protein